MAAKQTVHRISVVFALGAPVEEALLVELEEVGLDLDRREAERGVRSEDRDVCEVVEVEHLLELHDGPLVRSQELEDLFEVELYVQQREYIFDLAVVCIQIASQQLFELFAWVINDYSLTGQSIA